MRRRAATTPVSRIIPAVCSSEMKRPKRGVARLKIEEKLLSRLSRRSCRRNFTCRSDACENREYTTASGKLEHCLEIKFLRRARKSKVLN